MRLLPVWFALLVFALTLRAELDPKEWRKAARAAKRQMKNPGDVIAKADTISWVARDDSERAARLLVKWLLASRKLREGRLARDVDRTRRAFEKVDRRMKKNYGYTPPLAKSAYAAWKDSKAPYDAALKAVEDEVRVEKALAARFEGLRAADAIAVFVDTGDRDVARARESIVVRRGILRCLLRQPRPRALPDLFALARHGDDAPSRITILQLVERERVAEGLDAAILCLTAPEALVRRSAVAALRALDDPRCVPALVRSLRSASGLSAAEIERLLTYFTGRTFRGAGAAEMWTRWWEQHGPAWIENARDRYPEAATAERRGAEFYGIHTRSERIVFVLDRSGSMQNPVPRRRAPVSGAKRSSRVSGATKIEVAKNKLAATIGSLRSDVRFGVLFFAGSVAVWSKPPRLLPATAEHKTKAREWFATIRAEGSTRLFDALLNAQAYARTLDGPEGDRDGADTIFLLTDGAPTVAHDGEDEAQYAEFLEANRTYRCVVHTVGVGPSHARALLERIARDTGGTYRAVGVE